MRAIYKEPGKPARILEVENELEPLQKLVQGYIEVSAQQLITPTETLYYLMILNEEGMLRGMEPNVQGPWDTYVGPIVCVCADGPEFAEIPAEWADRLCEELNARSVTAV